MQLRIPDSSSKNDDEATASSRHSDRPPRSFSDLSGPQQQLLLKFQDIGWGSMHNLGFHAGDPVFDPPPKTCRKIKLRQAGKPRTLAAKGIYLLKEEQMEFINLLIEKQKGLLTRIVIQEGLPTEVDFEEAA